MRLYHFTSAAHLRGIDKYGPTVGDVPTDLARNSGRVGVWLTSNDKPGGNGLAGSAVDKSEIRLAVEISNLLPLHKWESWAFGNVTPQTQTSLERAGGEASGSWYVNFGWIKRECIVEAVSMKTGEVIEDWNAYVGDRFSLPAVPYFKKDYWHRQLLKGIRNEALRSMSMSGRF